MAGSTKIGLGNPKYKITEGEIVFDEKNINILSADQRAQLGVFLAFQNPYEIEGIKIGELLRSAYNSIYQNTSKQLDLPEFRDLLNEKAEMLKISSTLLERSTNVGFSGGEKKLLETYQLAVLSPKLAILDEIDSGLDVDALRLICDNIQKIKSEDPEMSLLVITHYPRILNLLKPDFVHVMQNGKITKSGGYQLAQEIEKSGYN